MSSQSAPLKPNLSVDELEYLAAQQREQVRRRVATLQQDVRRGLDVPARVADGIHSNPRGFYGAAAGAAAFTGYVLAKILKS